jgi:hypothetical protein
MADAFLQETVFRNSFDAAALIATWSLDYLTTLFQL